MTRDREHVADREAGPDEGGDDDGEEQAVSASPPSRLRSETASPSCTQTFRPLTSTEKVRRRRLPNAQSSDRSSRMSDRSFCGARPQYMPTGTRATSRLGLARNASIITRSCSGARRSSRASRRRSPCEVPQNRTDAVVRTRDSDEHRYREQCELFVVPHDKPPLRSGPELESLQSLERPASLLRVIRLLISDREMSDHPRLVIRVHPNG